MLRCVVFDIDDTLYLERDYVRSGFQAVDRWVVERLGISGFFDQAWQAFQTGLRRTIFDETLPRLGIEPTRDVLAAMVDVYRTHTPAIELLPDAAQCLQALHGRYALAVISDGPLASQQAKAAALRLSIWCHPIVLTESLGPGRGKPDPAAFRLVEESTGCGAAECVYIGDNPHKDFVAPLALGWKAVRVRRAGGLHSAIDTNADVALEADSLAMAHAWITGQSASG